MSSFSQSLMNRRSRKTETIETHLARIRFLEAGIDPAYGLMPWRILPKPVRKILLRGDSTWLEDLRQVFRGVPPARTALPFLSIPLPSLRRRRGFNSLDEPSPAK